MAQPNALPLPDEGDLGAVANAAAKALAKDVAAAVTKAVARFEVFKGDYNVVHSWNVK